MGSSKEGWPRIDAAASLAERRQAAFFLAREAVRDAREAFECGRFLGTLLGVDMPDSESLRAARGDAALMADRLRLAVQDYVLGLLREGPVAILVDSAQWADPASLDVLFRATELAGNAPWLLGLMGRSAVRVPPNAGEVVELSLRGLGERHVEELAASVAGRRLPREQVEALVERTEGNPLFVIQTVRALMEQGDGTGELPLPVTVEAALQARLDALGDEERELCRTMSIFDGPVPIGDVAGVAGMAEEAVASLVGALVARDVLCRPAGFRGGDGGEVAFASALLRQMTLRTLTKERAEGLHRRAARLLSAKPGVDPEVVARHHERGAEVPEARRWFLRAALEASARGDGETVLACSERALEGELGARDLFDLRMARGDAFRFRADRDAQEVELSEALLTAVDAEQRARAETELSWAIRARAEESLRHAEDAVRASENLAGAVRVRALVALAQALTFAGALDRAGAVLEEVGDATELPPEVEGLVWEGRGLLASAQGDLGGARHAYSESERAFRKAGHERRMMTALQNQADLHNRVYAFEEAVEALEGVLERSLRVGNVLSRGYAFVNLAYALGGAGRVDEALEAADQAEVHAVDEGNERLLGFARIYRLRALVRAGRREEAALAAAALAEESVDWAAGLRAMALAAAGSAFLLDGQDERARESGELALEIRDSLGALEEDEGEVFLVLGRALERTGAQAEARAVFARGAARVREMAAKIVDETWRERFLAGPAHVALLSCSA